MAPLLRVRALTLGAKQDHCDDWAAASDQGQRSSSYLELLDRIVPVKGLRALFPVGLVAREGAVPAITAWAGVPRKLLVAPVKRPSNKHTAALI